MQKILKKYWNSCKTRILSTVFFLITVGATLSGQSAGKFEVLTPVFDNATGITSCTINWRDDLPAGSIPITGTSIFITASVSGENVCLIGETPGGTAIHNLFPNASNFNDPSGFFRVFTNSSVTMRRNTPAFPFTLPIPKPYAAPNTAFIVLRFFANPGSSYTVSVSGFVNGAGNTISADSKSGTPSGFNISGNIIKPANPLSLSPSLNSESCNPGLGDAITNVTVTKTATATGLCFPGSTLSSAFFPFGFYEFRDPVSSGDPNYQSLHFTTYTFTPSKTNSTDGCCGIDQNDYALWPINWLLGSTPITNAEYLAADATGDGILNGSDRVLIAKCSLGIAIPHGEPNSSFPPNYLPWRFAPFHDHAPYDTYPGLGAVIPDHLTCSSDPINGLNITNASFWGVKRGDMNGSCQDCGASLLPHVSEDRNLSDNTLTTKGLRIPDFNLKAGQESLVPVSCAAIENASDILLELMLDPNDFEFIAIENGDLSDEYSATGMLREHNAIAIKYSWLTIEKDGVNIPDGSVLFYVRVRAKKDIQSVKNSIWLRSDAINLLLLRNNTEKMKFTFNVDRALDHDFSVKIIGANVLSESARVLINIPEASVIRFTILDSRGYQYRVFSKEVAAGITDILVSDLPEQTGICTIIAESAFGQRHLRLVKI